MIELLDYILDYDDNFWIVNNITDGVAKGYIVYRVSDGGKLNYITGKGYIKDNDNNGILEVPKKYKRLFNPREFYKNNKCNLEGIWLDYVNVLNEIGIEDNDIGIFGSYLIGFDITKDVDFSIYGKDNLYRYYENIEYIKSRLNVSSISEEHAEHQYNKHKVKFSEKCDLKEIITRNWSGIELDNGVLSTPRFIDLEYMSIPQKRGVDKEVEVKVLEGISTAMLPRVAIVTYNNEEYKVLSTLWKFQSFAHVGDACRLYGNVDETKKIIILDDNKYYINYLIKSNKIVDDSIRNDAAFFEKSLLKYKEKIFDEIKHIYENEYWFVHELMGYLNILNGVIFLV